MTAIILGKNLGLADSSQTTLGLKIGDPSLGRSGEQVYVNAASGNLMVQQQDDVVAARGLDINVLRTYNSQGLVDGDNNDNWKIGFYRQVKSLSGTVNTAGSNVTRVDQDGSEFSYTYDTTARKYIRKDAIGAYDTLSYNATTNWTWTDGDSRVTESYDWASGIGKLLTTKDTDGNTLTYTYTGSLLTLVTDASGEKTYLDYTGNNLATDLSLNACPYRATSVFHRRPRVYWFYWGDNYSDAGGVFIHGLVQQLQRGVVVIAGHGVHGALQRLGQLVVGSLDMSGRHEWIVLALKADRRKKHGRLINISSEFEKSLVGPSGMTTSCE